MSTVFLRELLESGFCGKHREAVGKNGLGTIHAALDSIIATHGVAGIPTLDALMDESQRVQLGNKYKIPYESKPHFDRCLQGIYDNRKWFTPAGHWGLSYETAEAPGPPGVAIRYMKMRHMVDPEIIEPVYSFYFPENYIPLHSLLIAFLEGWKAEQITVKLVSVCAEGEVVVGGYHMLRPQLQDLLEKSLNAHETMMGPACSNCPITDCLGHDEFEKLTMAWFKAKQTEEELRAKIREHLVWHGPTKVGAHLVFMKEHARRTLPRKHFQMFLDLVKAASPSDYTAYLSSYNTAVFDAVAKGKLPAQVTACFTQSKSHSIETGLSL